MDRSEGAPAAADPRVEALAPSGFASAAALLADAFFDNSAHVYVFPDPASRRARLRWLFARLVRLQHGFARSGCLLRDGGAGVDAMAFWHPPGGASVGPLAMLRHGLGLAPLRVGLAGTRRMFEADEAILRLRRQADPALGSWYLSNVAVRETLRGSGLGTALLGAGLRGLVDPSGRPATLMTQRPENVVFYERLGFEVVTDSRIGSGPRAFRNWFMQRPARSPRPAAPGR